MTTGAGALDRRVTFLRRTLDDDDAGNERGPFFELVTTWAEHTQMSAEVRNSYGYAEDQLTGWLTIREQLRFADLSIADRVRIGGDEFAIDSVPLKDRSGFRKLRVSRKMG